MTVNTVEQAWKVADRIFPTDYIKDEKVSYEMGYPIYTSTLWGKSCNAWISDLGARLEVNLDDGRTVNIWIDENYMEEETITTKYGTMKRYKKVTV